MKNLKLNLFNKGNRCFAKLFATLLLLYILTSLKSFSQNTPGNIGTANLTAWFNANDVVNGNVTTWNSTFPTGTSTVAVSDNSAPYSQCTNTPTVSIFNYNSVIDFNGNSSTNQKFLGNTINNWLLTNQTASDQGTFFTVYANPTFGNNDGVVTYKNGLDGIQMRGWGRIAIGAGDSPNGTRNYSPSQPTQPHISAYKGNKSSTTSMTGYRNDLIFNNTSSSSALMVTSLTFGAKRNTSSSYNEYFAGYLSEVIFFNRDLTASEVNKVNSYLAIKYAITLDKFGAGTQGDYTATDGTNVWDASLTPNYHNNVIGIARDDNEGLNQKQSHTFDDTTKVYLSALANTNIANTGSFNNNLSYLLIGSNNDNMCQTIASNQETPILPNQIITNRLEREWKITNTNTNQSYSVDFTLAQFANMSLNCLMLLVDDDGDFANGGTTSYTNNDGSGIVLSSNSGVVSVSNISTNIIPSNSTKYITIASYIPKIIASNDTSICQGNPITISALGANLNYNWNNSLGAGQSHTIFPTASTTYIVTGTDTNACSNTDTVNVIVGNASSSIDIHTACSSFTWIDGNTYTTTNNTATHTIIGGATSGCDSVVTLNLTILNPSSSIDTQTACGSFTWINGNTYTTNNNTATHTIAGGAANGCDSVVTLNLTISNAVNGIDNQTVCELLNWIDGNTYTTNNNTATHTIIGGATSGCDSIVTLNLTILNPSSSIDTQTACGSFTWINGNTYTTNNNTATHTIVGGAANGCDSIVILNLTIFTETLITISNDTGICNDTIVVKVNNNFNSYLWNNGETTSSINVISPGFYDVTVTDVNGCSNQASVEVFEDCPFNLWIPNVFTPNGDSYNNVFKVVSENLESLEVLIFNRWGREVFSWNEIDGFWDGKTKEGKNVPDGVYAYVVKYSYYNHKVLMQKEKHGHISVLR